ncbi:MAG: sulfatase-like hydrolase/transferase, partial [Cytophagales bacterium]|nr:sulfatase-like hydrolase/transferase [Cytophagales bacterium]
MKKDPSIATLNFILLLSIAVYSCSPGGKEDEEATKPNIVWIMLEDWGYQLSCYGEPGIQTPNIDKVAAQGIRYTRSFATSPVCSPSRSAMMTGFHQSYIGAHQHRTKNGEPGFSKKPLPDGIKPFTQLLGQEGYFTCFMKPSRKTDLNFTYEGELYQGKDWSEREEGQPFFAQVTFGGTHRRWKRDTLDPIDISEVVLPPYYPQTDLAKRDWANGLEAAQIVDRQVGALLDRLENEGLADNTLVFIIGDNGRCMPRGKQFLYDG